MQRAFVAGEWCAADSGDTDAVVNPANGDVIGHVPRMGADETTRAIQAAVLAQRAWAACTPAERHTVLKRWHALIVENADALARLMTLEQGKLLSQSRTEVVYGASYIEWFAEEARRAAGDILPHAQGDKRILVMRQPIGVTAAITPWNFPIATVTRKCAPALAAGCAQVLKPAPETPFCALALAKLGEEAGLPAGVFSVVTGDAEAIGGAMMASEDVRLVSFTGSTPVGKLLIEQSAQTVKKLELELGGHAPFIVFDDADLDLAADQLMACKFRNMGQVCIAANKIFVHEDVATSFLDKLKDRIGALTTGPGDEDAFDQGPLINGAAVNKVDRHVRDAAKKGAQVLTGGKAHALGGNFYEPTLLTGITPDMLVTQEETFGPVAPVMTFSSEKALIEQVNDTQVGLASYFFSQDIARVWRVAEALDYGMVGVNSGVLSAAEAPFGGVKQSGLGREGGARGLDAFLEDKYVCLGGLSGDVT
ncbi:MAG: NAD-dependent succinate-semialdehyde dehydrogenase [Pseudomonadota bacterium]